jgi:hypothetical protein
MRVMATCIDCNLEMTTADGCTLSEMLGFVHADDDLATPHVAHAFGDGGR